MLPKERLQLQWEGQRFGTEEALPLMVAINERIVNDHEAVPGTGW